MNGTLGSTYEMVPVDKIELDLTNPRVARWVEMHGGKISAEDMSLALGAKGGQSDEGSTAFYSLKESNRTNGRVIHRLFWAKSERKAS